jgi:hypothetical protein
MSFQNHNERREAALKAKQAMLEKFKNKAADIDPRVAEERAAAAKAREERRVAAEQRRRERVEMEKLERKLAAETAAKSERERIAREAVDAAKRRKADAEAAELREFEAQARRDLANAARKRR